MLTDMEIMALGDEDLIERLMGEMVISSTPSTYAKKLKADVLRWMQESRTCPIRVGWGAPIHQYETSLPQS